MEATYTQYGFEKSIERISEILDGSDASYQDHKGIPSRDSLSFTNGYYVDVTVLFVDIRGSKELSEKHTRPVLAKIYRAYVSEIVAVLKGNTTVSEIYIEGDGVWAVFNTTTKIDVNSVFNTAAKVASLIDVLNVKLTKKGYSTIEVGIGLDDGESLYIKAGYKGSGINEVVWIGRVVGTCAALGGYGNKLWSDREMMVSEVVYGSLTDDNKKLLEWNQARGCYHGSVVNVAMDQWVKDNG